MLNLLKNLIDWKEELSLNNSLRYLSFVKESLFNVIY